MRVLAALPRNRSFALAAIGSLALAVGANSAIFTLVDALWFRDPPVAEPERLLVPYRPIGASGERELSDEHVLEKRDALTRLDAFSAVTTELGRGDAAAFWAPRVRLSAQDPPLGAAVVGHAYFQTLGVPVRGRGFLPEEEGDVAAAVAVISDALWRTRFDAAEDIIGRSVATTSGPLVIVGIAGPGFRGARLGDQLDLWMPFGALPQFSEMAAATGRRFMPVTLFARLREGVTSEDAQAQVRAVLGADASVRSLRSLRFQLPSEAAGTRQDLLLRLLWMAAALMLLLGSANLAALMMARAEQRRHELALRMAIGATHATLARNVIAEALALCACGYAAGLVLRSWLLASLAGLTLPSGLTIGAIDTGLDWRVGIFAAVIALTGTAVASVAAIRAALRTDLAPLLAESRHEARRAWRVRNVLLAAHVALSVTLLAAAAALSLTVLRAFRADLGFSREEIVFLELRPSPATYPTGKDLTARAADYARLLDRLRALPGVDGAAFGSPLLTHVHASEIEIESEGRRHRFVLSTMGGGERYLTNAGARFVAGRDFVEADRHRMVSAREVGMARIRALTTGKRYEPPRRVPGAVVDTTFARTLWPGQPAIGRRFTLRYTGVVYEVIGVVEPVRANTTDDDVPSMFDFRSAAGDDVIADFTAVLRTRAPDRIRAAAASLARQAFPEAALLRVRTARDVTEEERGEEILGARVFSWFGIAGAILGVVGVYGLVTHVVARSRREIGIRAALGASTASLRRIAASRALRPVGAGLLAGAALSYWAGRALAASIAGLAPPGPDAFLLAAGLLSLSALLAAFAGASDVEGIDPADLLRSE